MNDNAPSSLRQQSARYPLSRRQPAAAQILEILRDRIVRGDLMPGSRIIEREICAEMNISRTPLREALKLLALDGLVELSQNRGARVLPFTAEEALHLFEVLAGLEGLAAELAVERLSPDARAELSDMHEKMRNCYERKDRDAYFALNTAIHAAIVEAASNPILSSTHAALMLRAKRGRYMAIMDPSRWSDAFQEHEALMQAFANRDTAKAGTIWREHLIHTGETVADVLRDKASH
ncbi:MAG: GntR family transcriptional regulator [Pseudomonadota bacterium]